MLGSCCACATLKVIRRQPCSLVDDYVKSELVQPGHHIS